MSRREFVAGCTVWAGAVLTGCAQREVPGARVTLTQWYHEYGEKGTQEAVLGYAREYSRLNLGVAIKVVWVPGDYQTKVSTALLTPYGPDIYEGQLTVPVVTSGQAASLDDLYTPADRADFLPQDLAMNSVNGKIYGAKSLDDTGVLYYRPSLFKQAGLNVPQTAAELSAAAKALTTNDRKGIFLGNDGGITGLLTVAPWSAGTDFVDGGDIVFDNDRTIAAYNMLLELNATDAVLTGAPTDWWDPSAFTQGLAAMQWSGLWALPAIRQAFGDDVGVMAWPALDGQGRPSTFLGGWSTMVNGQNKHVEEAKRYVKWLWIDNKQAQRDWSLDYGFHVPPRVSIAKTAPQLQTPAAAAAVDNMMRYGHFLPPSWSAAMQTALTDALTNIVKKGADTASEVRLAADRCRQELEYEID